MYWLYESPKTNIIVKFLPKNCVIHIETNLFKTNNARLPTCKRKTSINECIKTKILIKLASVTY